MISDARIAVKPGRQAVKPLFFMRCYEILSFVYQDHQERLAGE